jgi:hypothetical protein
VSESETITIRVVGLGGIGQPVATYMARYLGSLDRDTRLVLIDGDMYEAKNATRMRCHEVSANKAACLAAELNAEHDETLLTVIAISEYVTPDNIDRLLPSAAGDAIFLCVDNHATRKLVSDHAEGLDDVCLVSGGNDGIGSDSGGVERHGTAGNVQVHIREAGVELFPPLTRIHPEIADPADKRPDDVSCGELIETGVAPQVLFTNVTTAAAMMNAWYTRTALGKLDYAEVVFDIARGRMGPVLAPTPNA